MKFVVGDRVQSDWPGDHSNGMVGTVEAISDGPFTDDASIQYGIRFDSEICDGGGVRVGHNLGGILPGGSRCGWWVRGRHLKPHWEANTPESVPFEFIFSASSAAETPKPKATTTPRAKRTTKK